MRKILSVVLTVLALTATLLAGQFHGRANRAGAQVEVHQTTTVATTKLTQDEVKELRYMIQEEKLARDVFLKMYELYGAQVFKNIAESEQRHMDAIKGLMERYGVENPLKTDEPGKFADASFERLYAQLVAEGSKSLSHALAVGAKIEKLDIEDLEKALKKVTNPEVRQVFSNLKAASENHLRAFTGNGAGMGFGARRSTTATTERQLAQATRNRVGNRAGWK